MVRGSGGAAPVFQIFEAPAFAGSPVTPWDVFGERGHPLRATVSDMGPLLLSRMLGLNETQGSVVSHNFKHCDDNKLPLLDLKDFIKVLQFIGDEGKAEIEKVYGKISTASTGTILRKVIELQQQGADIFFGENHRRPDVAYLTDEQIARTAYGENQVPGFVIEVISKKDQMDLVHKKMDDYRGAGVKVVWHIFPSREQVHVYHGKNLSEMLVCMGVVLCSAAPVLPDFEMSANAIFQKPPKPA